MYHAVTIDFFKSDLIRNFHHVSYRHSCVCVFSRRQKWVFEMLFYLFNNNKRRKQTIFSGLKTEIKNFSPIDFDFSYRFSFFSIILNLFEISIIVSLNFNFSFSKRLLIFSILSKI